VAKIVALALVACVAVTAAPARAQDTSHYKSGPWHSSSIKCTDVTVKTVTPRLENAGQTSYTRADFMASGVSVTFNTRLGADASDPSARASVTHYQDTAGNNVMMAEHPGNPVQVCLVKVPRATQYCHPNSDPRGRVFRVWDYKQRAQYAGMNSEHDCGGA
jgi:hypothetical protein